MSTQLALAPENRIFPHYGGPPVTSIGATKVTHATAREIFTAATGFNCGYARLDLQHAAGRPGTPPSTTAVRGPAMKTARACRKPAASVR